MQAAVAAPADLVAAEGTGPQNADAEPVPTTGRLPPLDPVCPVLYLDSRYLVVSKPADVRIDGPHTHTVLTLCASALSSPAPAALNAARSHAGQTPAPRDRFVHRLDYATSGVLLLARTRPAAGLACEQFQTRAVRKTYLALVHGRVAGSSAVVDARVAATDGFAMAVGGAGEGRAAQTEVRVLARGVYRGAPVTKVALAPLTGRRHQLRLHARAMGHPIVGDATYAGDEARFFRRPGVVPPRMMLHAARLEIRLPPRDAVVYGMKSARKLLEWNCFEAEDPFVPERLEGLVVEACLPEDGEGERAEA